MPPKDKLQYHIQAKKGDVGRYVLLPGDPDRCEKIAAYFDNPKFISRHREYVIYTGTLLGEPVSVCSTGIGCPSTAIAIEELIAIGAETFIRVGTAGGIQDGTRSGEVAVVTGAIRDEGTTRQYLPLEFPAIADPDVVTALRDAAVSSGIPHRCGITQSKDSFYGETEPKRMPVADALAERWKAWKAGGAVCSEMESAAIFILSSIYRKRAGGAMLIIGDPNKENSAGKPDGTGYAPLDVNRAIKVAIEGLKLLIERDRKPKK
jgi:uridine phosphorylase